VASFLSIGEFSRVTFISVKALRHYHDVGILEPVLVDRSTGYRSYDTAQVPVAQLIRRLRQLEMPLEDVRTVVATRDDATRNVAILAHLERMEAQLQRTQEAVHALRALIEQPLPTEVVYRFEPARRAIARRGRVLMPECEAWTTDALVGIARSLRRAGIAAAGPPGALLTGELFESEEGEVVAFVAVGDDVARAPEQCELIDVPATDVAVMTHTGPYSQICHTYGALGTLVAVRDEGSTGPTREYFVVTPAHTADAASYRTEVCWPVRAGVRVSGGVA
jgi:DNA-binding transcriptional MerR regulator/effector-binding domain-containing protein